MTPEERENVLYVLALAGRTGHDPADLLNRKGLLVTERFVRFMNSAELYDLAYELEQMSVTDVVNRYGGSSSSGLDVQRGIVALIRDKAAAERRGT